MADGPIKIQYTRCWSCICRGCYDPPQAHTWMSREDAEHAGLSWPLTDEQKAASPCACRCAGGPGACVTLAVEEPDENGAAAGVSPEETR